MLAHKAGPTEDTAWAVQSEVPVIRQAAGLGLGLKAFYAVASPATWEMECVVDPPVTALEWETFISAVSHMVTGSRGILGSGAWEYKAGTLMHRMTDVAFYRLRKLRP